MELVSYSDISIISQFLSECDSHYPLLKTMLYGAIESTMYVDSIASPTSLFILGVNNWCYNLGQFDNSEFQLDVLKHLSNTISINNKPILWFGISEHTQVMLEGNADIQVGDYPRYQFEFRSHELVEHRQDTQIVLERITAYNIEDFMEYNSDFKQFWQPKVSFLEKGIGFIAMAGEDIIGHAFSATVCDSEVEIDLYTKESYRGKGISTMLSKRLISECMKCGLIPRWDCAVSNKASIKLAQKKRI